MKNCLQKIDAVKLNCKSGILDLFFLPAESKSGNIKCFARAKEAFPSEILHLGWRTYIER